MGWRIKDWNDVFEDYRSREVKRLAWLKFDLGRESEAYRLLLQSREGVMAYGVFWAIVQIAAKMPVRGVLEDERGPFTPARLSLRIGTPAPLIEEAIAILTRPDVGWLIPLAAPAPADCPPTQPPPRAHARADCAAHAPPGHHPPTTDGAPATHRPANGIAPGLACAHSGSGTQNPEQTTTSTSTSTLTGARDPEDLGRVAEFLTRRPPWLAEGVAWIDLQTALDLAALPGLNQQTYGSAWLKTKERRKTLKNPAGYFVSQLRQTSGGQPG